MTPFRKTRIAPTPSGYLHAGNALNFLLTAELAERVGASVLLRIDDEDRERYRPAYVTDIFETLHFLGIRWQEGPQDFEEFEQRWSQQHRMRLCHGVLKKLQERDCVFACACSRSGSAACTCFEKRLPLDAPGASWRILTDAAPVAVRTMHGTVVTAPLPAGMKNFIVRRKDGLPAYQLCSVVDDLHFGVDFIVRGADLWPSTLAQHYLAKCLGEEQFSSTCFYHHPLLTNNQGEKLSKSAGAFSVKHWRESGKTITAFFEYMTALLCLPVPVKDAASLLHVFGI